MFATIRLGCRRLRTWIRSKINKMSDLFTSIDGPASDCLWLLDVFLLLAGIRSERTSGWPAERKVRFFTNCLFIYQSFVAILQLLHAMDNKNDADFEIVFGLTKVAGIIVTCLKWLLLFHLQESIGKVRAFITSNRVSSGDDTFDELELKKFNQTTRVMMWIIYGMMAANAILLLIPNEVTKQVLSLPPQLLKMGTHASQILYVFSAQLLFLGVVPKFLSNMACIGTLIMGMRAKLRILAHRYSRVLNQPFDDSAHYFERLERDVREALDQHLDYWNHLQTLKDLVEKAFFIAHYYSLFSIGSCFYLSHDMGFNILSGVLLSLTAAYILKYYLLCNLVDSLQDAADRIGELIFEHCAQMPHSRAHHAQYMRMKTSLLIIWTNTDGSCSMNCMGMFEISTIAFVDFINIVYTVLMFLINVV